MECNGPGGEPRAQILHDVNQGDHAATLGGFKRVLCWLAACLFFGLAMVGVVLPGIPTTPFLLLMGYFLLRVSPAMHARALAWPVFGRCLRDWHDQGGVRVGIKIFACVLVTISIVAIVVCTELALLVKLLILCAALVGVSVVVRLPTARGSAPAGVFLTRRHVRI